MKTDDVMRDVRGDREMTEREVFETIQQLLDRGLIFAAVGNEREPVRWHLTAAGKRELHERGL